MSFTFDTPAVDEFEETISYRANVTGINHTIFISPRGNAAHGPRVKVAIDPPDSLIREAASQPSHLMGP